MKLVHWTIALLATLFPVVTWAAEVNINTATAEELEKSIVGIGKTKAEAIVKYRETHGPFTSIQDLAKVPGIKEKTLETLLKDKRNQLTVGDAAAPATVPVTKPAAPAQPAVPPLPKPPAELAAPAAPATPAPASPSPSEALPKKQ